MSRFDALAATAPDIHRAWSGIEDGRFLSVRREVRRRGGEGSAARVAAQLGAVADALSDVIAQLPEVAFGLPGGEEDWTVAQAVGHTADARSGLALAGATTILGRFPEGRGPVVTGVPGPPEATRDDLLRRIATSQRLVERAARTIAGHETDPCPLEHPLVGRLRCGEWLLFAGVHDLMHLEQLERLERELAGTGAVGPPTPA